MGGRGGSSSRSGGGGRASLPTLSGSERQIKWANDIRDEALTSASFIVRDAGSKLGLYAPNSVPAVSVSAAKEMRKQLIEGLSKVTSASKIIDNRNSLSYDSLLRIAGSLQNRKNKR